MARLHTIKSSKVWQSSFICTAYLYPVESCLLFPIVFNRAGVLDLLLVAIGGVPILTPDECLTSPGSTRFLHP